MNQGFFFRGSAKRMKQMVGGEEGGGGVGEVKDATASNFAAAATV